MARTKGARNKPKPGLSPAVNRADDKIERMPIPPAAPSYTADPHIDPKTFFDPKKFEGGFDTAVGDTAPEAVEIPGTPQPEPIQARRGRPPGPRVALNISGIEKLLLGIHTTLLAATGIPEMEMSKEEAAQIAEAYGDVCKHYPQWALPSHHAAVVNLGTTLSIVYGSRIVSWRARQGTPRARRPEPAPAQAGVAPHPAQATTQEMMNGIPVPPEQPAPVMTQEIRTGEIAGVGSIVFGEDHPLVSGKGKLQ